MNLIVAAQILTVFPDRKRIRAAKLHREIGFQYSYQRIDPTMVRGLESRVVNMGVTYEEVEFVSRNIGHESSSRAGDCTSL